MNFEYLFASDDFSYANPDDQLIKKIIIRSIERISGQPHLKRMYEDFRHEPSNESFWDAAIAKLEITLKGHGLPLEAVPAEGPIVFIANHPYGILDGMALCWLAQKTRPDFKILINSALCRVPELADYVLPVDFSPTTQALETNLASRQAARKHLEAGKALLVFPSGAIANTPVIWKRKAAEWVWQPLAAKLIRQTQAKVLPIHFFGQNSWKFQVASHIHPNLRLALVFNEVYRRRRSDISYFISNVLSAKEYAQFSDARQLIRFLQAHNDEIARRAMVSGLR